MRTRTAALLETCKSVLSEYSGQITVRQLYYRLVAAQAIPNVFREYKNLCASLTHWRKQGLLDAAAFCDLTREPVVPSTWSDLSDFLETVEGAYRRDPWQQQERRPEVWLEKEALATVFEPVCRQYGVVLQICRGYPSVSCLVEAAKRTQHILYFGDFDPSGQDIPRCVVEELRDTWEAEVDLDQIALTQEQIAEYSLPAAPAKSTDSRTPRFVAAYGDDTVELDALPPDVLQELLRQAIGAQITDPAAWHEAKAEEDRESARLRTLVEGAS